MIDRTQFKFGCETCAWMLEEGIEVSTFIGDGACEPTIAYIIGYDELIDQTLNSFMSPEDGIIAEYHHDDVINLISSLEEAVSYAKTRAKQLMRYKAEDE